MQPAHPRHNAPRLYCGKPRRGAARVAHSEIRDPRRAKGRSGQRGIYRAIPAEPGSYKRAPSAGSPGLKSVWQGLFRSRNTCGSSWVPDNGGAGGRDGTASVRASGSTSVKTVDLETDDAAHRLERSPDGASLVQATHADAAKRPPQKKEGKEPALRLTKARLGRLLPQLLPSVFLCPPKGAALPSGVPGGPGERARTACRFPKGSADRAAQRGEIKIGWKIRQP